MKTLIHDNEVPPGGWRFFEKETNTLIEAGTGGELRAKVISHRQSNNLPVGLRMWEEIQEQICSGLDENHCTDSARPRHAQSKRMDIGQIVAGTLTLLHWFSTGKKRVDLAEANRRASICAGCEFNQKYEGCQGCQSNKLLAIVTGIAGNEKTAFSEKLNACQLCGCSLEAKVWLLLDLLLKHTPKEIQEAFPEWCWLKVNKTSK